MNENQHLSVIQEGETAADVLAQIGPNVTSRLKWFSWKTYYKLRFKSERIK